MGGTNLFRNMCVEYCDQNQFDDGNGENGNNDVNDLMIKKEEDNNDEYMLGLESSS